MQPFLQCKATVTECLCIPALGIGYAQRMRRIRPVLSSVTCQIPPHFVSTLSHKWHHFREKKIIAQKTCVIIYSATLKHFSF